VYSKDGISFAMLFTPAGKPEDFIFGDNLLFGEWESLDAIPPPLSIDGMRLPGFRVNSAFDLCYLLTRVKRRPHILLSPFLGGNADPGGTIEHCTQFTFTHPQAILSNGRCW
jgi:hypothetical protein